MVEADRPIKEGTKLILSNKASFAGCYLDYLNARNNFLNALNLESFEEKPNKDTLTHYLRDEDELRDKFIKPLV